MTAVSNAGTEEVVNVILLYLENKGFERTLKCFNEEIREAIPQLKMWERTPQARDRNNSILKKIVEAVQQHRATEVVEGAGEGPEEDDDKGSESDQHLGNELLRDDEEDEVVEHNRSAQEKESAHGVVGADSRSKLEAASEREKSDIPECKQLETTLGVVAQKGMQATHGIDRSHSRERVIEQAVGQTKDLDPRHTDNLQPFARHNHFPDQMRGYGHDSRWNEPRRVADGFDPRPVENLPRRWGFDSFDAKRPSQGIDPKRFMPDGVVRGGEVVQEVKRGGDSFEPRRTEAGFESWRGGDGFSKRGAEPFDHRRGVEAQSGFDQRRTLESGWDARRGDGGFEPKRQTDGSHLSEKRADFGFEGRRQSEGVHDRLDSGFDQRRSADFEQRRPVFNSFDPRKAADVVSDQQRSCLPGMEARRALENFDKRLPLQSTGDLRKGEHLFDQTRGANEKRWIPDNGSDNTRAMDKNLDAKGVCSTGDSGKPAETLERLRHNREGFDPKRCEVSVTESPRENRIPINPRPADFRIGQNRQADSALVPSRTGESQFEQKTAMNNPAERRRNDGLESERISEGQICQSDVVFGQRHQHEANFEMRSAGEGGKDAKRHRDGHPSESNPETKGGKDPKAQHTGQRAVGAVESRTSADDPVNRRGAEADPRFGGDGADDLKRSANFYELKRNAEISDQRKIALDFDRRGSDDARRVINAPESNCALGAAVLPRRHGESEDLKRDAVEIRPIDSRRIELDRRVGDAFDPLRRSEGIEVPRRVEVLESQRRNDAPDNRVESAEQRTHDGLRWSGGEGKLADHRNNFSGDRRQGFRGTFQSEPFGVERGGAEGQRPTSGNLRGPLEGRGGNFDGRGPVLESLRSGHETSQGPGSVPHDVSRGRFTDATRISAADGARIVEIARGSSVVDANVPSLGKANFSANPSSGAQLRGWQSEKEPDDSLGEANARLRFQNFGVGGGNQPLHIGQTGESNNTSNFPGPGQLKPSGPVPPKEFPPQRQLQNCWVDPPHQRMRDGDGGWGRAPDRQQTRNQMERGERFPTAGVETTPPHGKAIPRDGPIPRAGLPMSSPRQSFLDQRESTVQERGGVRDQRSRDVGPSGSNQGAFVSDVSAVKPTSWDPPPSGSSANVPSPGDQRSRPNQPMPNSVSNSVSSSNIGRTGQPSVQNSQQGPLGMAGGRQFFEQHPPSLQLGEQAVLNAHTRGQPLQQYKQQGSPFKHHQSPTVTNAFASTNSQSPQAPPTSNLRMPNESRLKESERMDVHAAPPSQFESDEANVKKRKFDDQPQHAPPPVSGPPMSQEISVERSRNVISLKGINAQLPIRKEQDVAPKRIRTVRTGEDGFQSTVTITGFQSDDHRGVNWFPPNRGRGGQHGGNQGGRGFGGRPRG